MKTKKNASKTTSKPKKSRQNTPSAPLVGIVMGSDSDLAWMQQAADALKKFNIPYEMKIVSAHRTPNMVTDYSASASARGLRVIIAGAGGAAHLPGMMAAHTVLPVIGVPCPVGPMQGEDALWSIVQMPKGIPVATVAIGNGWNAGVLAAQILATGAISDSLALSDALQAYKLEMEEAVARMNEKLS